MASPRQSGLNRRAGMGMKLSGIAGAETKSSSIAGGIFGSDFEKWSQYVYPSTTPFGGLFDF
jgi:hypothetical protein